MVQKTIKQHTDEADTIVKHVRDADALIVKLRDELDRTRATLHALRDFAPADRFKIEGPYHLRKPDSREPMSMLDMIKAQNARINLLLGDLA